MALNRYLFRQSLGDISIYKRDAKLVMLNRQYRYHKRLTLPDSSRFVLQFSVQEANQHQHDTDTEGQH